MLTLIYITVEIKAKHEPMLLLVPYSTIIGNQFITSCI